MTAKKLEPDTRSLIKLMSIGRKGKLRQHCRSATIRKQDFAALILGSNAGLIPWQHAISHRDIFPDHLNLTDDDLDALTRTTPGQKFDRGARTTVNKISQMFRDRRLLVGHMFYTPDHSNWHFFYFDQRDLDRHRSHWEAGPHIHLINHLWPEHTAEKIWERFKSENVQVGGGFHIRFIDERRAKAVQLAVALNSVGSGGRHRR